jgi:two-component system OmpR family sensor kinase
LLHDVSHELRSPLARLHAAAGLLRQDPSKLQPSLERIEREIGRLDALIGELLELARLEAGTSPALEGKIDLAGLVRGIAEDAAFEAQSLERQVSFEASASPRIRGHAALVHRAVENVVRNAVKHTSPGTTVTIRLDSRGRPPVARLIVTDHGRGVPDEELGRIFEPFYQAAGVRSANGFGLGLAIAQRAIGVHGGTIRASNVPGGGLCVQIELPHAAP